MSARLLLVRHGPTPATRAHVFPDDEALDGEGLLVAARLAGRIEPDRVIASPRQRCRQTAAMAGFAAHDVDERFAELDFGTWTGRPYADIWQEEPDRIQSWLDDPTAAPHGGEPLQDLVDRVTAGLADLPREGTTAVFCHGGPIGVSVMSVLGAPPAAFWNLRITPASITEFVDRGDGEWALSRLSVDPRDWRERW